MSTGTCVGHCTAGDTRGESGCRSSGLSPSPRRSKEISAVGFLMSSPHTLALQASSLLCSEELQLPENPKVKFLEKKNEV